MRRAALLALQFLTRIPVRLKTPPEAHELGRSVLFYPLVGLFIGSLLLALQQILPATTPLLNAALLIAAWIALTGALHLDGLADCADAWIGAHGDPERALRILKDPCSGPVAVATVSSLLLTKFAALASLPISTMSHALLAAPVAARALLVAALRLAPQARAGGLSAERAASLPTGGALIVTALAGGFVLWIAGISALLAALITALIVVAAARRLLGGITGDVAGALCELSETAVLIVLALAAAPGDPLI